MVPRVEHTLGDMAKSKSYKFARSSGLSKKASYQFSNFRSGMRRLSRSSYGRSTYL